MSRVAELLRSRRVPQIAVLTLMSVGFAGCSADMQTRFSQNTLSNPFNYQPEATGYGAAGAGAPGRASRTAAIFAAANPAAPVAIPVIGLAATAARRERAAILSGRQQRRVGRRARAFVLHPAEPAASSRPPARVAPRSVAAAPGAWRHHDHRRHQRHARHPGASATTFRRPRSCRPMATRDRARCRPASS